MIACGLLKVPFPRYVTAHIAGSSAYIGLFLALGAIFGPSVLDRIHLPMHAVRLLWLLPLAVGLPLLIVYWARRVRSREPAAPSRRRVLGAVLLGGFVGAVTLTATLATAATVAELLGASHPLNVAYSLLGWTILGLELDVGIVVLILYGVLLSLLISVVAVYYEVVLPYLAPHGAPLLRQVVGLALLVLGFFGIVFLFSLFVEDAGSLDLWWRTGRPIMLLGAAVGIVVHASTAVYGRTLAIAMTPTLRRDES